MSRSNRELCRHRELEQDFRRMWREYQIWTCQSATIPLWQKHNLTQRHNDAPKPDLQVHEESTAIRMWDKIWQILMANFTIQSKQTISDRKQAGVSL